MHEPPIERTLFVNHVQSYLFKNLCCFFTCYFFEVSPLPCPQVRDRTTLYLSTLGGDGEVVETDRDTKTFLFGDLDIPLVNLETSLKNYVSFLFYLTHFALLLYSSHVFSVDAGAF